MLPRHPRAQTATYKGVRLYIKLQLDGDYAVVIQLKRR